MFSDENLRYTVVTQAEVAEIGFAPSSSDSKAHTLTHLTLLHKILYVMHSAQCLAYGEH